MGTRYGEARSVAKDVRQGVTEQRPAPARSARRKALPLPFVIEQRSKLSPWRKWRAYPTRDIAEAALANLARKYAWSEWRIREEAA